MTDYSKHLSTFGEMGVVCSIAPVKAKLEDQEKMCMFLCYAQNHTSGTYRMLNLRTKYIILRRDIIWLKKTYGQYVPRKEIPRRTPIS